MLTAGKKSIYKTPMKVLSAFLAFILVVQILPLSVFANDIANKRVINSIQSSDTNYENLKIVEEITEPQNNYSRTFLLEDGSYCEISSNVLLNNGISQFSLYEDECTVKEMANNLAEITSQSDEKPDIQFNDGLVVQDSERPLNIYCAELTENDSGDYDWRLSDSFPQIHEFSVVMIRPSVSDNSINYNKSQVTIDASIKLTCNSESDVTYDTYVQTFNDKWPENGFVEEDLLAYDDNYDFVNTSGQIYDYNSIDDMGNYVWNITSAYIKWENGTEKNNGLFIKTIGTESVYITGGVLLRHYRVIDENDNGFTYHYEDMGRAGTLRINDYTNVPTLLRNELSIDVGNMPVSVTRSINVGLNNNSFGAAGRWNYSSELTYSNDTFVWNMIDGSSKRFKRADTHETDEFGREKWVEYLYNGGESVLWVEPSSLNNIPHNFSKNIIVDDENNTNHFNSKNKLVSITSKDDKSVDIEYSKGDNISSITDGAGHKFVFDNNGFVAPYNFVKSLKVLSSNGKEISFDGNVPLRIDYSYTVKNNKLCLSNVTYPDGKTVAYDYDDFGRLVSITNIDENKLDIEYYNSNASENLNPVYFSRIKSYTKSAFNTETNSYKTIYTINLNSNDAYRRTKETVYESLTKSEFNQYNSNLDVLYSIDSNGNTFYADYDKMHNLTSYTFENSNISNLIVNGDMHQRKPGGKLPANWNPYYLDKTNCSMPEQGSDYCVQFDNSIGQLRGLYQDISIDGHKDDKYIISGWGKAMAIIPTEERFWGIRVVANNDNGVAEIIHEMAFDTSLWDVEQIRKTAFALPFDTKKLTIQLISYNQVNTVQFDDIELYKADNSYVASVDDDNVNTTCNCSNCTEPNCPCKCENEEECNCIYCKRGIKTETNSNGVIETIKTDGVNSIASSNAFTSSNNYLASSTDENGVVTYYDYNENTGKLTSFSNSSNSDNKINYTYNAVGLLRTVSQTVTNIMTGESVDMVSTYTYDGDNLIEINHSGSVYSFDYDLYGNISNVSIGNQSLASYKFNSNNQLNYLLYGNGDRINYTYDSNGNITSVSLQKSSEENDSAIEYTYSYNEDGTLLSYTDNVNGTVTNYDNNGYTIIVPAANEEESDTVIYSSKTSENNETDISLFGFTHQLKTNEDVYDVEKGQTLSSMKYTIPLEIDDVIAKGNLLTINDYFGREITSSFDFITDKKVTNDVTFPPYEENIREYDYRLTTNYTYVTNESITTNLVKSCTTDIELYCTTEGSNESILKETFQVFDVSYDYDTAGRISKVYQDGIIQAAYKYDEAGQLTEEAKYGIEGMNGYYLVTRYTYDCGGNIASRTYYQAHLDEENNFVYDEQGYTFEYSYEDSNWNDLLTEYNGETINYDEIGNPLNYSQFNFNSSTLNEEFEWNGRLMTSNTIIDTDEKGSSTSTKVEYEYNSDGLRTKKIMYALNKNTSQFEFGKVYDYIWENNMLKGYQISAYDTNNADSKPELSRNTVVLPIYNSNNEVVALSIKMTNYKQDEETGDKIATTSEDFIYLTRDAQGNVVKYYSILNGIEINLDYDAQGKLLNFRLAGKAIDDLDDKMHNSNSGSIIMDMITVIALALALGALYEMYIDIAIFTYRGYMYDFESGLYYNQSRYYSGEWGRFLNADDPKVLDLTVGDISGANLFAYCNNDPCNKTDAFGFLGRHWYNKVSNVAKAIDIVIWAISTGVNIHGITAMRKFIKANRKLVIKTVQKELLKLVGTTMSVIIPAVIDLTLTIVGTSIGDLIAKAIDNYEYKLKKGYVRNNGYILN